MRFDWHVSYQLAGKCIPHMTMTILLPQSEQVGKFSTCQLSVDSFFVQSLLPNHAVETFPSRRCNTLLMA